MQRKMESLRCLSDNAEFYNELVAGFQLDAERSILVLANAMGAGDYPAMREAVHALEGSSMELGAVGLASVAGEFRRLKPFELKSDRAKDLLEQLRQTLAATLQRLTDSSTRARDDRLH
jgi:two-component system sensor histidine kinase RpfC